MPSCVRIMLRDGMTQDGFMSTHRIAFPARKIEGMKPYAPAFTVTISHGLQNRFHVLKTSESVAA